MVAVTKSERGLVLFGWSFTQFLLCDRCSLSRMSRPMSADDDLEAGEHERLTRGTDDGFGTPIPGSVSLQT